MRSRVLSGGKAEVRQTAAGLEVSVPESDRQPIDTIVALELDGSALDLAAVDVPGPVSLTTKAKATASNIYPEPGRVRPRQGRGWQQRHPLGDRQPESSPRGWKLTLASRSTFSRAVDQAGVPGTETRPQVRHRILAGRAMEALLPRREPRRELAARFEPVTAQRVRLNITEATDGPTIWEFQLFK